jgi:hypothetical protein
MIDEVFSSESQRFSEMSPSRMSGIEEIATSEAEFTDRPYSPATNPRPMNDRKICATLCCRFFESSINSAAQSAGRSSPISTTSDNDPVLERVAVAASAVGAGAFKTNEDMESRLGGKDRHTNCAEATAEQISGQVDQSRRKREMKTIARNPMTAAMIAN